MRYLRLYILLPFGMLLFSDCSHEENNPPPIPFPFPPISKKVDISFVGEWRYSNSMWYLSELSLKSNGTFTFHDQSCYGQKFSEGQWTNKDDLIFLTSFDEFKAREEVESVKPPLVRQEVKRIGMHKKGMDKYLFVGFKETTLQGFSGPNDTIPIFLNNVQLQLRNDTLYYVSANELPAGSGLFQVARQH